MTILVNEFLKIIERLAPAGLAEEWDNVGLQTGARGIEAKSVLVALNVTGEVLDEAAQAGCSIILAHHPLIFPAVDSVSEDSEAGRLISRAIRDGIAVVAAHTNLDSAPGGLADILAELMDLRRVEPIQGASSGWSKLAVFVPPEDLDRVRAGLFAAGAGGIGDYRHCSWVTEGKGTFLPMEGAHPAVGKVGRDEVADELRLETVFPSGKHDEIVAALMNTHSYEEPAYDIYPLETRRRDAGSGRVGELAAETTLESFAGSLAEVFGMRQASYSGDPGKLVRRVAVAPGSGAGMMAAAAGKADVLVTGDYKYHHTLQAEELGLALIDIPHDISEHTALASWAPKLQQELSPSEVKVMVSSAATGFWRQAEAREKTAIPDREENSMHHLHVDGGSRGNPGPAGIGVVLAGPDGEVVDTLANYIGKATNNIAEYQAMVSGLELALERGINRLAIFSDSELIVRQLEGAYKVKNEGLRPYYQEAKSLLSRLEEYEMKSIPREANAHADELVNRALDEAGF
ncbi:MAG: Nif3-like dinuclear metal center hexameric protein [Thermoleophilia bacterium]